MRSSCISFVCFQKQLLKPVSFASKRFKVNVQFLENHKKAIMSENLLMLCSKSQPSLEKSLQRQLIQLLQKASFWGESVTIWGLWNLELQLYRVRITDPCIRWSLRPKELLDSCSWKYFFLLGKKAQGKRTIDTCSLCDCPLWGMYRSRKIVPTHRNLHFLLLSNSNCC